VDGILSVRKLGIHRRAVEEGRLEKLDSAVGQLWNGQRLLARTIVVKKNLKGTVI
jgi:hypothetical protein